jgi:type I restriction enzyme S subunit
VKLAKLGDVAEIERDGIAPEKIVAGTPYLGLEHIESGGRILSSEPVEKGELASTKFQFGPDHLLYGKLRPYLAKIALPDFSGICSTDILPVRPGSNLDKRYLAYFLRQPSMVAFANSRATGANLPRLSPKALADVHIPMLPLAEQRRIAAILDQADALGRKRAEALSRLNALGQAIFYEMFAGEPSAKWPKTKITDVVDVSAGGIRTGPFGSQLLHSEFVDNGIAVLGIDNAVSNTFRWAKERYISHEKYESLRRYTVHPGDVLITIMGTCGRCAVVPADVGEAINTKHLCCISLQKSICLPEYLHAYFLHHPDALHYLGVRSKGAIMDGLNMGIIKDMPLTLPPITLQHSFVRKLGQIDACLRSYISASQDAERLFTALQHRAFRGEL